MKTLETDLTGANRENRAGRNFSVLSVSSCSNPGPVPPRRLILPGANL